MEELERMLADMKQHLEEREDRDEDPDTEEDGDEEEPEPGYWFHKEDSWGDSRQEELKIHSYEKFEEDQVDEEKEEDAEEIYYAYRAEDHASEQDELPYDSEDEFANEDGETSEGRDDEDGWHSDPADEDDWDSDEDREDGWESEDRSDDWSEEEENYSSDESDDEY